MPAVDGVFGNGLDLVAEFLSAILTVGGIGWLLDWWLGTGPWLLLAGVMGGFACGLYLMWLRSRSDEEVEAARRHDEQRRRRRGGG